jgi:transcriptional regulator with XRE-family HTH domain
MTKRRFTPEQNEAVGERIRILIKERRLTIKGTALAMGYRKPATLIRIMEGMTPLPEQRRARLANILGVDPDDLLPKS